MLLDFFLLANGAPLQGENHIRRSFKKANVFFPAHAAFAMLQADKLLLHFPAAVRADLIALSHLHIPQASGLCPCRHT